MKAVLKSFVLLAIVTVCFGFSACGDDEPKDSYYVNYSLKMTPDDNSYLEVELTTEGGVKTFVFRGSFEHGFGPLEYGDKLVLNVKRQDGKHEGVELTGKILVSKNQELFTVKAEKTIKNQPLSLSYTINY